MAPPDTCIWWRNFSSEAVVNFQPLNQLTNPGNGIQFAIVCARSVCTNHVGRPVAIVHAVGLFIRLYTSQALAFCLGPTNA